jgi:hypothetical protein
MLKKKLCLICKKEIPYEYFYKHFKMCRQRNVSTTQKNNYEQGTTNKKRGCGCGK